MSSVATDASRIEVLRRPGHLELTSTHRHSLGFYTAVCSSARFTTNPLRPDGTAQTVPSSPHPTLDLLYTALHHVIAQHPPLSVTIEDEASPSARYVRVPSIDLERMVYVQPVPAGAEEDIRRRLLNKVIQERLSSRFDDLGVLPPWRIVAFFSNTDSDPSDHEEIDVALFIHHAIADGMSSVIFMQSLLAAMNIASSRQLDKDSATIVTPPTSTFLPPLEQLRPLPISYFSLLKTIWHMWLPPSRAGLWTAKPVSRPLDVVQTRHAILVFSDETATGLLAACRAHKTTLTPLLETLIARAFFTLLPADGSANRLKASCPINLRPFLPEEHKTAMGTFTSADEHEFKREDTDIWKEAPRVGSSLSRVLDDMQRGRHFAVGMLRYIPDVRAYLEGMVGKPRGDSFEVSNTGAVVGSGEGAWRISQSLFTQSASIAGAAVKFNVSSVRGGPMTVSASWVEGVVEDSIVDAVLENVVILVEKLCAGKL